MSLLQITSKINKLYLNTVSNHLIYVWGVYNLVTITERLKKDDFDVWSEYPNIVIEKVRSPENVVAVLKSDKRKKTIDVR